MDPAKRKVDRACELLTSPTPANLDLCAAVLESTVADVARLESRSDAGEVLEGIRKLAALLESAAEFHRQWGRSMSVLCAGYEAGGEVRAITRKGSLSLAG